MASIDVLNRCLDKLTQSLRTRRQKSKNFSANPNSLHQMVGLHRGFDDVTKGAQVGKIGPQNSAKWTGKVLKKRPKSS